jgi:hypothetical protein
LYTFAFQRNSALCNGNRKEAREQSDLTGERVLECYTVLFRKIHFQDVPFLWLENADHVIFHYIAFFEKHEQVCCRLHANASWVSLKHGAAGGRQVLAKVLFTFSYKFCNAMQAWQNWCMIQLNYAKLLDKHLDNLLEFIHIDTAIL